ncbi:MAG: hypothetical protein U1A77_25445 [Pirellulales bacterium]
MSWRRIDSPLSDNASLPDFANLPQNSFAGMTRIIFCREYA